MSHIALLGKEGPPPPLSPVEAVVGVGVVLAGIVLALVIAGLRNPVGIDSAAAVRVCAGYGRCHPGK